MQNTQLVSAINDLRKNKTIPNISELNPFSPDILPFKFADNLSDTLKHHLGHIDIDVVAERYPKRPGNIDRPLISVRLIRYEYTGRNWIANLRISVLYKDEHITDSEVFSITQPSIYLCICATRVLADWHPIKPTDKEIPLPSINRGLKEITVRGTMLVKETDDMEEKDKDYDLAEFYPMALPQENYEYWHRIPLGITTLPRTPQNGYSPFTLEWNLRTSTNIIITGRTGSGKTDTITAIALESYARGFDCFIIDTNIQTLEREALGLLSNVIEDRAKTLKEARDMLIEILEWDKRVAEMLRDEKCEIWYNLPDSIKPTPRMLLIDGLPYISDSEANDAADTETKEKIDLIREIQLLVNKIVRGGRITGIHTVIGGRTGMKQNIPGELWDNAMCHLRLGVTEVDTSRAVPKGRGVLEFYINNDSYNHRDTAIVQIFYWNSIENRHIIKQMKKIEETRPSRNHPC